jgi:hypothetical protein
VKKLTKLEFGDGLMNEKCLSTNNQVILTAECGTSNKVVCEKGILEGYFRFETK